ncbi:5-formyltetrahydrofolate cyclo-ligase [Colwellia sp. RSH04]|uniref:5-formyltetrahydrofolate cyclo-ligase n=1 Tax=Colwellia sp. RSH04 TaxID=2305464 RepID=UPI000E58E25A|nr:5-formyltetrahydrofolate cyclo-ligase [Colwellia sp. RSH04]RHW76025.1 5-formyltetrahydrofolate cyclo-ligase [Colwellia sp. RSH04]
MKIDSRAIIRKNVRLKRKNLTITQQNQASIHLLEQLTKHAKVKFATKIAIYLANDGELNPQMFIQWCWQQNKEVYLPVIHPFNKHNLLFLRYRHETNLVKNKFNIEEPELNVSEVCPSEQLDLIFTPLVAFDASGARLGMGGGFYDRTLTHWHNDKNKSINSYPIGLAHDCQQVEKVPIEAWDIPLPEIITPSQVIQAVT